MGAWVFDVDGTLFDSLTGTALRPGAAELLAGLHAAGEQLLAWSAGGAEHARARLGEHGLVPLVDRFLDKGGRGEDGRYRWTGGTPLDATVFVDDHPEDLPADADVVAVSPFIAANPHDRALGAAVRARRRARWRADGWYGELTVRAAIARAAAVVGDTRVVFADADSQTELVLRTLHERAGRVAAALGREGLAPGDRVVVHAPASADATVGLVGLWLAGAVVVPVVAAATPEEVADIVDRSGARRVLGPGAVPALEAAGAALGPVPPPAIDAASPACIIYTSGSTAAPKGVIHSHETVLAGMPAPDPAGPSVSSLMTFPSGHIAAVLGLLRTLVAGGTTVVMDRWSPRRAAALIEEHRLASSAGTPFYLATLLDEAERTGADISSLRLFLVGAASVPPALVDRAGRAGIIAWRTYGSTEHPAISSGLPTDAAEDRTRTDGRVGAGNEVRIVGDDGRDVPPGVDGEILARGPKQFLGYADPILDDEAFVGDSWFRTGDVGRLDRRGHLTITDRMKDIVIRGGENISAKEVEDALATHPAVAEVAIVAGPDLTYGERVCAFVIPGAAGAVDLDALRAHLLAAGMAAHKLPVELHVVDVLPRTPAGKVRKLDLRRLLGNTGGANVNAVEPMDIPADLRAALAGSAQVSD